MERGPLLTTLLALYLLPCAVQDLRTRHVSNWLTIPAFVVAWPLALWLGTLPFTLAVFAGCYVAWHAGGMGPADGKLAVPTAAVAPEVLVAFVLVTIVALVSIRIRSGGSRPIPATPCLLVGALVQIAFRHYFAS